MKAAGERKKPEAFRAKTLVQALMFHPWAQHSAQMVTAQLQEMGSLGSQAVCAKAMKMAFYDNAQLEMSFSGILKVKHTVDSSVILLCLILFSFSEVNNIRWFIIAFCHASHNLKRDIPIIITPRNTSECFDYRPSPSRPHYPPLESVGLSFHSQQCAWPTRYRCPC